MTLLESSAILLANELENCIKLGIPLTSNCINALNDFRKTQLTQYSDLDNLYKQLMTPVLYLPTASKAKLTLVKKD